MLGSFPKRGADLPSRKHRHLRWCCRRCPRWSSRLKCRIIVNSNYDCYYIFCMYLRSISSLDNSCKEKKQKAVRAITVQKDVFSKLMILRYTHRQFFGKCLSNTFILGTLFEEVFFKCSSHKRCRFIINTIFRKSTKCGTFNVTPEITQ